MRALEKFDILIIDDDVGIRTLLRHALQRVGMRCRVAVDGLDGAHQVREAEFAVVLLDLMMPRVDGFGFLEYLREWQGSSGMRPMVLLMTAAPDGEQVRHTGDMVQAVISKPFDVHAVADLCHDCVVARRDQDAASAGH
ncbi:MAG TPA: response regulator [Thermoanaerobaculia bacterium]|nr:response regulator [Thermoanaerobaculia bacterium]